MLQPPFSHCDKYKDMTEGNLGTDICMFKSPTLHLAIGRKTRQRQSQLGTDICKDHLFFTFDRENQVQTCVTTIPLHLAISRKT